MESTPVAPPPKPGFYRQAARASWVAPLIGAFGGAIARRSSPVGADCVTMLMVLCGFVLAAVALVGMAKVGRAGILGHAIAGLIVNGLLVLIFVSNAIAASPK